MSKGRTSLPRNFGFGRNLAYAGYVALLAFFGGGRFATVATHAARFKVFSEFVKNELGIRDLAKNCPQEALERFAEYLQKHFEPKERECLGLRELDKSYAQNLISSAQVTLRAMTGDFSIGVSPSEYVGKRTFVRNNVPASIDLSRFDEAIHEMQLRNLTRAAAVCLLARHFGMRLREASLADLQRLIVEANGFGMINVIDGTKGGRKADRWIKVSENGRFALEYAATVSPHGSANVLHQEESWSAFRNIYLQKARRILTKHGIEGFHDMRAAFACQRYRELCGVDAPCFGRNVKCSKECDERARRIIAYELGHGRSDITVAYAGGRR